MKMYINIIAIWTLVGYPIYLLAENITWKNPFFDKIRKRLPIFNQKPFTCTKCLSTWMMIFTLVCAFPFSFLNYGLIASLCFIYFLIVQMHQNEENQLMDFNLSEPLSNYKYILINKLGKFGTIYKLKIFYENNEIVTNEFNSISDRENFIYNFKQYINYKQYYYGNNARTKKEN